LSFSASSIIHQPIKWAVQYTHWLHDQWPAGKPEKMPVVQEDGSTNVSGLRVVGDLTGIPLLKLSVNAGTRAAQAVAEELKGEQAADDTLDLAIIGGGTAGFAAAKEAERLGLRYLVFEAAEPFATIANFPKGKPIYKYPTDLPMEGGIEFHDKSDIKEGLIEDLREQTVDQGLLYAFGKVSHTRRSGGVFDVVLDGPVEKPEGIDLGEAGFVAGQKLVKAKRVIVAIGRSGNYRKLGVPGEDKEHKVSNRLHDPKDFRGQNVLVVGGGDSAMEAAISLAESGAAVTLSYRKPEFNRPKPENRDKIMALAQPGEESATEGSLELIMGSNVSEIRDEQVDIDLGGGTTKTIDNSSVFTLIGREAPLDFFRRSGVRILGERDTRWWVTLAIAVLFFAWVYHWKSDYNIPFGLKDTFNNSVLGLNPSTGWDWIAKTFGGYFTTEGTWGHTLMISASGRSFYYTMAYATLVLVFGIRRIKRRKTPYVKLQTLTLTAIQVVPLFLLPELILPYMGHNGLFSGGVGQFFADTFFPEVTYGHGREYWRAYGFILAWPLMAWNWFTDAPLWGWLILGFLQTFVAIPLMIRFWGKGAYCGWICSCGALAETLGDAHRHKMPHGPFWNRLNMIGQVFLAFAFLVMGFRILGWVLPDGNFAEKVFKYIGKGDGLPILNYAYLVDLLWAGIIGVALYFHFSGRVWCRFACPLAALMHIYARFSKFRILADKKKCISCNVCTSVCHQGIDIMNFANKGEPMADPECVRCSACVQMCPTGVLDFGQVGKGGEVIKRDPSWLAASPVQMAELTVEGKRAK